MASLKKEGGPTLFSCNGTMMQALNELIKRSGLHFSKGDREPEVEIIGSKVFGSIAFFRPHDIPDIVNRGKNNAGLTGYDMFYEWSLSNKKIKNKPKVIAELHISGRSRKAADVVIACKKGSAFDPAVIKRKKAKKKRIPGEANGLIDRKDVFVQTEYLSIAKEHFKHAKLVFSAGSTEEKVAKGIAGYGIFVRDSGKSMKKAGLVVVKVLFSTPIVLIAKKRTSEIENFAKRLQGALEAEKHVFFEMNVPATALNEVIKKLPAMRSPTVSKLATISDNGDSKEWYSIKTVVEKTEIMDLQHELEKLGATDFVEYEIMVMQPKFQLKTE